RHRVGAANPGRSRRAHAREDHSGDRAPALDHRERRPHRGHARRAHRRIGPARGAPGPGRPLRVVASSPVQGEPTADGTNMKLQRRQLPAFWLRGGLPALLLAPLGWLMAGAVLLRRQLYRSGLLRSERLPVPVIVVGNIFVGGTGKTPLVIWLCQRLQAKGRRPGVVLRGYGGRAESWPQRVTADSDPDLVGDEAVLLARQAGVPVAAGPRRAEAARLFIQAVCQVIVHDDGLQHEDLAPL